MVLHKGKHREEFSGRRQRSHWAVEAVERCGLSAHCTLFAWKCNHPEIYVSDMRVMVSNELGNLLSDVQIIYHMRCSSEKSTDMETLLNSVSLYGVNMPQIYPK